MTDGERITALEVEVKHTNKKLDTMATKLDAMHHLLQQAKGAKRLGTLVVVGISSVAGFTASYAHKIVPFLNVGPR